jgi:hypothetical protein
MWQQKAVSKDGKFVHHELEYFSMLLNLDVHLRCAAFVCPIESNFCRVIDELRATVGNKAINLLSDVSCPNPPCMSNLKIGW